MHSVARHQGHPKQPEDFQGCANRFFQDAAGFRLARWPRLRPRYHGRAIRAGVGRENGVAAASRA
ncbi:hypothetical protein A0257_21650 [Hymenobacter psoromatis]|nr:hypothetical protein A0257_21650 [Hymenobacter psoromatis]